MYKKLIILFIITCGLFLLFPPLPKNYSLTNVFRITEEPVAITHGTYGSALTVNISFGDDEVLNWIKEIKKPYPTLFIDIDWAGRFPETIRIIKDKNIPTALLGQDSSAYENDAKLLVHQIDEFENIFGEKPLWFRTKDEVFSYFLHELLWEAEVNAIGSSYVWTGGEIPPEIKGEIISVPHHRKQRVNLAEIKRLSDTRDFQSIENVIFGIQGKTKKIPK
ncbi:hypothetical protein JSQ81_10685 [Sporosarcina sp. Marseille-Q4063]|uniref:hypothetical protein n=1 Tax=Sporosarcina sp. Marseille-Q4063 TaxID=2810514 RepID=UPI001BAF923D|nr:hypothetical protein [Sporosarcina sp. Marseille-Q4063]QUW20332.1 hypothetical protein JSQ81_10685 [Sporosarcina sp. Marseille-Q4063]